MTDTQTRPQTLAALDTINSCGHEVGVPVLVVVFPVVVVVVVAGGGGSSRGRDAATATATAAAPVGIVNTSYSALRARQKYLTFELKVK